MERKNINSKTAAIDADQSTGFRCKTGARNGLSGDGERVGPSCSVDKVREIPSGTPNTFASLLVVDQLKIFVQCRGRFPKSEQAAPCGGEVNQIVIILFPRPETADLKRLFVKFVERFHLVHGLRNTIERIVRIEVVSHWSLRKKEKGRHIDPGTEFSYRLQAGSCARVRKTMRHLLSKITHDYFLRTRYSR